MQQLTKHIAINNRSARYQQRDGFIICNNSDYQVKFIFDSEWSSVTDKWARFDWGEEPEVVRIDEDTNTCPVPAIPGAAFVKVGVYTGPLHKAVTGETWVTTDAIIPCKPSVRSLLPRHLTPSADTSTAYLKKVPTAIKSDYARIKSISGATQGGSKNILNPADVVITNTDTWEDLETHIRFDGLIEYTAGEERLIAQSSLAFFPHGKYYIYFDGPANPVLGHVYSQGGFEIEANPNGDPGKYWIRIMIWRDESTTTPPGQYILEEAPEGTVYKPYQPSGDAVVTRIESMSANGMCLDTIEIPEAVRNLPGYGREGSILELKANEMKLTVTKSEGLAPLDTPRVTTVSTDAGNILRVAAGGSLRFVSEHKMAVLSDVVFVT